MLNCYNSSTASKRSSRFPDNYPKQIVSAKGAYIYDKDGKEYLDFCCSLGPIILGHRYPAVDEAVIKAITDEGTLFSLSHPKEWILAELLCEMIPSGEMVKFAHNGVDVTTAAIRLARHITGRELVLSFSYHGCQDVFMACTKTNNGVPISLSLTIADFDYNDIEKVKDLLEHNEVAAIILEPHTIRKPEDKFLEQIRDLCNFYKTILIFDEVVSFPRYPKISAQAEFNVTPDLTCISKGMANGYPISALVGKEKYMKELKDGGVFFSTTFGGCNIGVSAAIATLNEIRDKNVLEHLNRLGKMFRQNIKGIKVVGSVDSRLFFEMKDDDRQRLWQEAIKEGIFFHVPIFFNYSMTEKDILKAVSTVNGIGKKLDEIEIEGYIIREVFKKR